LKDFDILDAIGNIDDDLIIGARKINTKRASRRKMIFGSLSATLLLFIALPLLILLPKLINSEDPPKTILPPPATVLPPETSTVPETTHSPYETPPPATSPSDFVPYPIFDWKNRPSDEEIQKYTVNVTADGTELIITNKTIKTGMLIWFANVLYNSPESTVSAAEIEASKNKIEITVSHPDYNSIDFVAVSGYIVSYTKSQTYVFELHDDLYNELLLMLGYCDGPIEISYNVDSVIDIFGTKIVTFTVKARNAGEGFIYTADPGLLWSEAMLFNENITFSEKERVYDNVHSVKVFKKGDCSEIQLTFVVHDKYRSYDLFLQFNGHKVTFHDALEFDQ